MARKLKKKSSKFTLGIALLILGGILVFGGNPKVITSISFETEPISVEGFEKTTTDGEGVPRRIVIPNASIDLDIERSDIIDGYWEVFEDSAGWGDGSGLPGEAGNQVIFAHARKGLFLPLRDMKRGDQIYVYTNEDLFAYIVDNMTEVFPNQIEVVAPTVEETLTLFTCSGYKDSKRLIVTAKRV